MYRVGAEPLEGQRKMTSKEATTSVVLADDHAVVRQGLKRLINRAPDLKVIGEASDGRGGLEAAAALSPDVVLLDIGLPDVDGFEVADRLAASGASPSIVLISSRDPETYRQRIDSSAAVAFLAKHELDGGVLRALVGLGAA